MKRFLIYFLMILVGAAGAEAELAGDPRDPDFIHASLVISGPGKAVYQVAGHAMIRMECPAAGLDNIFSFENEGTEGVFGALFRVVNGRFIVSPADVYLEDFEKEDREVISFPLNLEPLQKQRLWQVLDSLTTTGEHLFNIRKESCSGHILQAIDIALRPSKIQVIGSDFIGKTNAEEVYQAMWDKGPWRCLSIILNLGTEGDMYDGVYNQGQPTAIAEEWEHFYIAMPDGHIKPLLLAPSAQLTPAPSTDVFTPVVVAVLMLVVSVLSYWLRRGGRWTVAVRVWQWALAVLLTAVFVMLAVIVSSPSAIGGWGNWNWLIFNPVPLILLAIPGLHRRWWQAASLVWLVFALLLPFTTTTIPLPFSILALAAIATYLPVRSRQKNN